MATQSLSVVNPSKQGCKAPWERMPNESAKAYSAFREFKDLGPDRTYGKVAKRLQKSEPLMAKWGKRFNWHNRALDFDQYTDQEMQRQLFSRRARARKRALDIADILDEKIEEAIREMVVVKVIPGKKGESGQPDTPDERKLMVSPTEVAQLFRVSQEIQHRILGKDEDSEVYEFHVHIAPEDPRYAHEQPEAVQAARKKAREEQQDREQQALEP